MRRRLVRAQAAVRRRCSPRGNPAVQSSRHGSRPDRAGTRASGLEQVEVVQGVVELHHLRAPRSQHADVSMSIDGARTELVHRYKCEHGRS